MLKLDYAALGFKAGLEVHHQLNTEKKLFCRCPVRLTDDPHDSEVLRHMRPTLSELGEYDGTALMEFKTRKEVTYQIFRDLNCTYEMDDTPPFLINQEALQYAMEIAMILDCSLVDEVHVSRKQYLDGSIPTGFQRTAIIGVNGKFPLNGRNIPVMHLGLEEDACREVSDQGHRIVFKADRLGIPLVEVVTGPDFTSPEEVKQGAEQIRRALWRTGRVRRGPGSVRQDVNVSISGGTRIEIKGVPTINIIPVLVENEVFRQYGLLKIRDELRVRGITAKRIDKRCIDVTRLIQHSDNTILLKAIQQGFHVTAAILPGFGGLLDKETQPGIRFAREFAGRIRVIACIDSQPNMLYPTCPHAAGIPDGLWRKIRNRLKATHLDEIVLVWGSPDDLDTAVSELFIRAREAAKGIPSETRQALPDGTNDFERILPGPDRMYPDTDHPPRPIEQTWKDMLRATVPDPPWCLEELYHEWGLDADVIKWLAIAPCLQQVQTLAAEFKDLRPLVGRIYGRWLKSFQRKKIEISGMTPRHIRSILAAVQDGTVLAEAVPVILYQWVKDPELPISRLIENLPLTPLLNQDVKSPLKAVSQRLSIMSFPSRDARWRYAMGVLMNEFRGRIPGKQVSEIVMETITV